MIKSFIITGLLGWSSFSYSLNESKKPIHVRGLFSRSQILDATAKEFRPIGSLTNLCSGTLVGPKHVLTAAHCVYRSVEKIWQNNLDFTPARVSSHDRPFGRYEWKKVYMPRKFYEGSLKAEDDFAIVELEEDIGLHIGFKKLRSVDDGEVLNHIQLTGYPGDRELGTMWNVHCPAVIDSGEIHHQCDTFAGMSGSGIYDLNSHKDIRDHVIGIHTYGGIISNGGMLINEERLKTINKWIQGEVDEESIDHENIELLNYFKIYAINKCKQTIDSYFSSLDFETGFWINKGTYTLIPGLKNLVSRTPNTFYYFWAESYSSLWSGENNIFYDNQITPMYEKRITLKDWGQWVHEFDCDQKGL